MQSQCVIKFVCRWDQASDTGPKAENYDLGNQVWQEEKDRVK